MERVRRDFGDWSCVPMFAFDAVNLLPSVLEVFSGDELLLFTSETGRKIVKQNKEKRLNYVSQKEKFSDEEFLRDLFEKSILKKKGKEVNRDKDFTSIFELFEVMSFIIETTYAKTLSQDRIQIPEILMNVDKLLKNKQSKPTQGSKEVEQAPKINAKGVFPPGIHPWLFKVLSTINKQNRFDWILLKALKTEMLFGDFVLISDCIDSVMSFEASYLLESL